MGTNKDEFIKFRITPSNKAFLAAEAKLQYTTMTRLFDRWLEQLKENRKLQNQLEEELETELEEED